MLTYIPFPLLVVLMFFSGQLNCLEIIMIYLELVKVQLLQKSRKLIMGYAIVLSCLSQKLSVQVFPTYTIYLIVQLAKKLHPDTNKDDPEAEKKFQEVQKAYEVCDRVTILPW